MKFDLPTARSFMAGHARALDRRRFQMLTGEGDPAAVLAAVDAYRNTDGGYGWGLEPDLRSPESQPGAALHAFEAWADIAPATAPHAVALCDWLESVTLPDGGLPFALTVTEPTWSAPWWAQQDATKSSLQITAVVAVNAHRVAAHDPAVAAHPWLARATRFCLDAIGALGEAPPAIEFCFAILLLDAVHDTYPEAPALLAKLGAHIPATGMLHVEGGTEDEMIRPLDFAPAPGPARSLFAPEVIDAELERLAAQQEDDGGWTVEFAKISPAGVLDWRGHATVRAVSILQREDG